MAHTTLSSLLSILSKLKLNIPKDPRALLSTQRETVPRTVAGGSYFYFGIDNIVRSKFCAYPELKSCEKLSLHINIDGLPLFYSSSVNLWPILGTFKELPTVVFPIAIYCGKTKPNSLAEYLNDFINEVNNLIATGILYDDKRYTFKLDAIICDAPARAFIKCIKGHYGCNSYERCVQQGERVNGKVILQDIDAPKRTDEDFRRLVDQTHHVEETPLTRILNFQLVSRVPLDYMH